VDQVDETRVGAKRIQPGIDVEDHHPPSAFLKSLFKPFESLVEVV
jgi:hypothetical protein